MNERLRAITTRDHKCRHCERSAAIHRRATSPWIAAACGLAMTAMTGLFAMAYQPGACHE
ncbi:MAG: hypothetical protein IPO43_21055 [Rhodoferax sp.]|nr:hypothetical protein [Rhodoferax sp.]